MNHCYFIGNLTRDPESRTTSTGIAVTSFTIAVNERGKDNALFLKINAWRGLADVCRQYLNKGDKIAVSGSLSIEEYTSKKGEKVTSVVLTANDVEFLNQRNEKPVQSKETPNTSKPVPVDYTPVDMSEELPF